MAILRVYEVAIWGWILCSPINCNHLTTSCQYNPYSEFDLLKDKLNAIDVSFVPGNYDPRVGEIPESPAGLASLSDMTWPSEQ
jgi:hypothetical protein